MSELDDLRQYKREHFGVICKQGHHTRTADLLGDPNDADWQCAHCIARGHHPASGDTIEQAARVLAESDEDWLKQRGVHEFMTWDGLSEASREQYRNDARRLAARGLLAGGPDRRRVEAALPPLRDFHAGAYETPEEETNHDQ